MTAAAVHQQLWISFDSLLTPAYIARKCEQPRRQRQLQICIYLLAQKMLKIIYATSRHRQDQHQKRAPLAVGGATAAALYILRRFGPYSGSSCLCTSSGLCGSMSSESQPANEGETQLMQKKQKGEEAVLLGSPPPVSVGGTANAAEAEPAGVAAGVAGRPKPLPPHNETSAAGGNPVAAADAADGCLVAGMSNRRRPRENLSP